MICHSCMALDILLEMAAQATMTRPTDGPPTKKGCNCASDRENGPFYTQLGYCSSPEELRKKLEVQLGTEITLSEVTLTKYEGQSERGCPDAWWVIPRSPKDKKVLNCV